MRVLMTADPLGGVFTYALELARALGEYGIHVHLATMGGPLSESQRRLVRATGSITLHASGFRLEWMDDPWDDVARAGMWLCELAAKLRPDLVHLNGFAHATLDLGAPKLVVAHSCVGSWWRAVHGTMPPPRYDRYLRRVGEGLRAADVVVAPTASFLREIVELYGPLGSTAVVYNGIAPLDPGFEREPVVLAAGRLWDPSKNVAILDQVAEHLRWPVYVAGETRREDGTEITAQHARLLGPLPRPLLIRRMRRSAILCHPARYEPFGLVPLEAAAAGCALVLGDLPTLREVWGDAAWYVPSDDPDAIRAALDALSTDPDLRDRRGALARARALSFGIDRTAREMVLRYLELAPVEAS